MQASGAMAQVTQKMRMMKRRPYVRLLISSRMLMMVKMRIVMMIMMTYLDFLMAGVARLHTTIIMATSPSPAPASSGMKNCHLMLLSQIVIVLVICSDSDNNNDNYSRAVTIFIATLRNRQLSFLYQVFSWPRQNIDHLLKAQISEGYASSLRMSREKKCPAGTNNEFETLDQRH